MNNLDNIKETKEIGTLTKKELEMMNVLWQSETALTASEILKASRKKSPGVCASGAFAALL